VYSSPERHCKPGVDRDTRHPGDLFTYFKGLGPVLLGPSDYSLVASHDSAHRLTVWYAMGRGEGLYLAAFDSEARPGGFAVERWVTQEGKPMSQGGFVAGPGRPHPASAVVRGTAPFSGTAHYSHKGRRVTGTFRVRFPGLTLSLTGHGWKAGLYDDERAQ
jgi:hypothetical protein